MNENTCVLCGAQIPEGSQVCYECMNKEWEHEKADREE